MPIQTPEQATHAQQATSEFQAAFQEADQEKHPKLAQIREFAGRAALYSSFAAYGAVSAANGESTRDAQQSVGNLIAASQDPESVNPHIAGLATTLGHLGAQVLIDSRPPKQ